MHNNILLTNNNTFDEVNLNKDNNVHKHFNKKEEIGEYNNKKTHTMEYPKWTPNLLQRAADVELILNNSSLVCVTFALHSDAC